MEEPGQDADSLAGQVGIGVTSGLETNDQVIAAGEMNTEQLITTTAHTYSRHLSYQHHNETTRHSLQRHTDWNRHRVVTGEQQRSKHASQHNTGPLETMSLSVGGQGQSKAPPEADGILVLEHAFLRSPGDIWHVQDYVGSGRQHVC